MSLYNSSTAKRTIRIDRDTDGEIMAFFDGPRGPVPVEISAAYEDTIERALEVEDDIELADLCEFVVSGLTQALADCFTGNRFSHFADGPDDNSDLVMRQRTGEDIQRAREAILYCDLQEGGLTDSEIQQFVN